MDNFFAAIGVFGTVAMIAFLIYRQTLFNRIDRQWQITRSISGDSIDTFKYGNNDISSQKYAALRESYFAMRMDYAPRKEKIGALLMRLDRSMVKARSDKEKVAIQKDIDILSCMGRQAAAGFTEWRNYQSFFEETMSYKNAPNRIIKFPNWLALVIAVILCLLLLLAFFIGERDMFHTWFFVAACTMATDKVLRTSRNIIMRRITNIVQVSTLIILALLIASGVLC